MDTHAFLQEVAKQPEQLQLEHGPGFTAFVDMWSDQDSKWKASYIQDKY